MKKRTGKRAMAKRPTAARKHRELLAAVGALAIDAQDVERGAGLPQGWLSKAKRAEREGPKADAGWVKLEDFITRARESTARAPESVTVADARAVIEAPEGPVEVPEGIARAFEGAATADELLEVGKRVAGETARGAFDPRTSDVLQGWSRELRQVLEMALAEKAQAQFSNLVPMTLDQAREFWALQETKASKALKPGESAAPPKGATMVGGATT